jgi:CcmD family protein
MGHWGFVLLAYGIVWAALAIYLVALKNRMRKAEARLSELHAAERAKHGS